MTEKEFRAKYGEELTKFKKTPFGKALLGQILDYLKPPKASIDDLTKNGMIIAYMYQAHGQASDFIGSLEPVRRSGEANGGEKTEDPPPPRTLVPNYVKRSV